MGKCHFNESWLTESDISGVKVSTWAKKVDDNNVYCCCCEKKIPIARGFQAIQQHAKGSKHQTQFKIKCDATQMKLSGGAKGEENVETDRPLVIVDSKKLALKAEIIWTLRCISKNLSFKSSTDDIKEVFEAMFPGCIPEGFQLSEKKIRYLITDALFPYFKTSLQNDICGELSLFT